MLKKILIIISLTLLVGYLIMAMTLFNFHPQGKKCNKVEVIIKDTSDIDMLTKGGVVNMLRKRGISLIGKNVDNINTNSLQKEALKFPLVRSVECYKTLSGKIRFEVTQRIPVLHVMDVAGRDYYIDNLGQLIPNTFVFTAYRPIVTGTVNHWFAVNFLYKLGVFIYYNNFWRSFIQQINVLPNWDIELVPRVGNHVIFLGRIDNFENKLNRLFVFYQRGLNQVGWNKYSRISLEFGNQIICTKRPEVMAADSIK